jgi:hypothetical protein
MVNSSNSGVWPGLYPALRTAHVGNADGRGLAVHATDVLVDQFWFVTCGGDASWLGDEGGRHRSPCEAVNLARNMKAEKLLYEQVCRDPTLIDP